MSDWTNFLDDIQYMEYMFQSRQMSDNVSNDLSGSSRRTRVQLPPADTNNHQAIFDFIVDTNKDRITREGHYEV